jgi:hypothetical protein
MVEELSKLQGDPSEGRDVNLPEIAGTFINRLDKTLTQCLKEIPSAIPVFKLLPRRLRKDTSYSQSSNPLPSNRLRASDALPLMMRLCIKSLASDLSGPRPDTS